MTDMDRVTPAFIADNAAGTLQGWFDGYTEPDDDVGGQVKVTWIEPMTPHKSRPDVYLGMVEVVPMERHGVDPSQAKWFRIGIRVVEVE